MYSVMRALKHSMKRTKIERFMEKVTIPGKSCWRWNAYKNREGYGLFRSGNKIELAHRVSYELFKHKSPGKKLVCHHCDNTSCVNPKHLFLGTDQINTDDKVKKHRHNVGSQFSHAKFTESKVKKIRKRYATGNITTRELAEEYGVAHSGISNILNYRTWRHV